MDWLRVNAVCGIEWHLALYGGMVAASFLAQSSGRRLLPLYGGCVEEVERLYPGPSLVHHAHEHVYPERLFPPYSTPHFAWEEPPWWWFGFKGLLRLSFDLPM